MEQTAADLQRLKGIGKVLAKRLQDAGLASFASIAQAGAEGLKKVGGISPRIVGSILEQAQQLSEAQKHGPQEADQAMKEHLAKVREKIQSIARATGERFQDQLTGKYGNKLTADLVRIEDTMARLDQAGRKRCKRVGRALQKAEKRLAGLEDAGLKKVHKGLKRARKGLLKAVR